MNDKDSGETQQTVDCEVCIVGAGIAGLNALFAVTRHLSPSDKVVLVDSKQGPAGMWNTAYNYVRLHQPHPMFTAGNIRWRGQTDPHHLATRAEVFDHLQHCFAELSSRVNLDPRFGYTYLRHDEGQGDRPVMVDCKRDADGARLRIRARRLIKALGYNITPQAPLALSSKQILSLAPESAELLSPAGLPGAAPIYVVGGGKTGMDTAHMLLRTLPGRKVRMLIGQGTMFLDRDKTIPRGLRRYYAGSSPLDVFLDVAAYFNGRNEHDALRYMRTKYCVSLDSSCERYRFGVMSPRENAEVRAGLDEVVREHLADVVDEAHGPVMVLRSGQRRPIESGAVFINCTGFLDPDKARAYEPYLSAGGRVLSIQPTSTVHFLSSQSAYFLTHLLMLGTLADAPLYEVDGAALNRASRAVFPMAALSATLYNSTVFLTRLPRWVHDQNGLDVTRMYPLHRRLFSLAKLMLFLKRHPTHLQTSLDVVRERFDIRLGLLSRGPAQSAPTADMRPAASLS